MQRGNIAGVICLCIWSTLALGVTLTGNTPPLLLTALVCTLGSLVIFTGEVMRGVPWRAAFTQPRRVYAFGAMGIGLYTLLFNIGLKLAPPYLANALNYLWPVFLTLGLAIAVHRRPHIHELAGLALGLIGAVIIFIARAPQAESTFGAWQMLGCLSAFIGAVVWATYSVLAKRMSYPPIAVSTFFFITGIICAILHVLFEPTIWPNTNMAWIAVIYLAIARLSYSMWDYAMKHGDQNMLATLSYLVPLGSMAWLVLAGHMPNSATLGIAGGLIIAGSLIANYQRIAKLFKA